MLFIKIVNGKAVYATATYPKRSQHSFETRNNWKTMEDAERRANQLNQNNGPVYLAIDNGPNVHPRFDIIEAPCVGEPVSYSFNGDSYPDGKIVHISKAPGYKVVTTDTGSKYYRRKQSARWMKQGGTWSMILGHVTERNPHV